MTNRLIDTEPERVEPYDRTIIFRWVVSVGPHPYDDGEQTIYCSLKMSHYGSDGFYADAKSYTARLTREDITRHDGWSTQTMHIGGPHFIQSVRIATEHPVARYNAKKFAAFADQALETLRSDHRNNDNVLALFGETA